MRLQVDFYDSTCPSAEVLVLSGFISTTVLFGERELIKSENRLNSPLKKQEIEVDNLKLQESKPSWPSLNTFAIDLP
ncbi:hypothetical protein QJS10_CPA09g02039 [Acorus calamus]|uniref:Uncharacterized protein n=1 Tax=Acorus calamus TaxID=4465 RepID=A0AAV9E7E9_ACOCL|nr:hypothetical protein QJS10_CPA09g02039 [Acorus calamus]